jgi:hypothetical protein
MNEDAPPSMERILAVEAAVEDMRSQNEATHNLLKSILERLGPTQAQNAEELPQRPRSRYPSPASPITPAASRRKVALKPAFPPDFNGDRTLGKAFLTSCRTYIRLCPEAFDDDEAAKIIWAMSYMKTGRASRWATREFELEVKTGHLRFLDWIDFEEEFRKDFLPLDAEAAAVNTLETTSYFQGKRTVDDYLDQFRDLIHDSGYVDPKTIVVKFRRGLDRRISAALAGMASGRPSDMDPEAWFRLAVQMDQNRAADEAFQASYRQATTASTAPATRMSVFPRSAVPTRFAHSNPSPGNPVPMDIDAARKAKAIADNCRRCGLPGHWARDCPQRYDVRFMETDELERTLEDKLAAKDAVPAEEKEVELEDESSVADFVSHSG